MKHAICRACGAHLTRVVLDLGRSPVSNAFARPGRPDQPDASYPLKLLVCDRCWLAQLEDHGTREGHFHSDYAYFSSFSETWLAHARDYADMAVVRFGLGPRSRVVEVASNDGYLLQHFVRRGIPALGVDPAANCARMAREQHGVETEITFFGLESARRLAAERGRADLIIANNVLAHVPDLNDFVAGFAALLHPGGTATFEFPHLLEMLRGVQFDTIYHEHYSYLSLIALTPVFARHGLALLDVERLPTHGGSLRLYVGHAGDAPPSAAVRALVAEERAAGLDTPAAYAAFEARVESLRRALLALLRGLVAEGRRIVGYGAPAKGNTLLNYCGIGTDILAFTVDRSPAKQGLLLPGTRIPIRAPEAIFAERPDFVLILPWNLREEIINQMAAIRAWGGRFIIPVPVPMILD